MDRIKALSLTLPGVWGAFVMAWVSFTPSLLPRAPFFQGLVAGFSALVGYAMGIGIAWVWREFADRDPRQPSARSWWVVWTVGPAVLVLATVLGARSQWALAQRIGVDHGGAFGVLLAPVVGLVLFLLVLVASRGVRLVARRLTDLLDRWIGRRAARAGAIVITCALLVGLFSGVLWRGTIDALDRSFALGDLGTPADVTQPDTPLRSGSEESLVEWDELGVEGRVFVGRGPDAAEISDFTGSPALEPIRVFAGLASQESVEERARLAVDDLVRAGGLERENLLVVTTTGSGWVEPSSTASFEFLTGGDSAIVSMQYSYLPSWLSYVVDQNRAREAGRQLFDEVYGRISELDPEDRPKLYVFGESLGSFGGETAFSGEFDLANRVDGALFVGPPRFNPLYRDFVEHRDPGSREVEPVYKQGRIIRFVNSVHDGVPPEDAQWGDKRVLYVQHASDPITWWTPSLMFERPDWLTEERGRDVPESSRWFPMVTFWQVSADMALGFSSPAGHGHNYTGEHGDGWAAVLGVPDWTEERSAELRRIIMERHGSHNFD